MENNISKEKNDTRRRKRIVTQLNKKQNEVRELINKLEAESFSAKQQNAQIDLKEKLGPIFEQMFEVCELFNKLQKEEKSNSK